MSLKQLAVLFSFTISWAQCGTLSPAAADSHPNIVFIMVDDMGWADLGCYGQQAYATPNLDQMAKEGIRFTESYSGCTVCAPARCTLMTGLHMGHAPLRGNTGGIPLPDSAVTIPEVLREAGYVSGGFGKWGLGDIGGTGVPGPIDPGETASFTLNVNPDQVGQGFFTWATMVIPSNDAFLASPDDALQDYIFDEDGNFAGPLVIVAFAVMYFTRVPKEEAMMRDIFGQDYDTYVAQTGRLWPKGGMRA